MKSGLALFMAESYGQLAYDSDRLQRNSRRVEYVPRDPESTVMHRVTREYLETFLVEVNLRSGDSEGVPDFIEDEFRKFLDCGILAKGFARLKCDTCDFERLVPFSCKCRGVCPSCAGRRMAERAAHLVDEVFPEVPVRQFVLSLPFALRYKLAWDHKLTRAVLGVFSRALLRFYSNKARAKGIKNGRGGAVTVIQRAGGALNLNVHFHTAALDGVFTFSKEKGLEFHRVAAPTKDEMASLVRTIRKRVLRLLERRGIVLKGEDASYDSLAEEYPALAGTYAASIQHLVALGPRSGRRVMRFGADPEDQSVRIKAKRHARLNGFDLHASKAVRAGDKERLERLLRYLLRPPVAQNRLKLLDDGKVLLELKVGVRLRV